MTIYLEDFKKQDVIDSRDIIEALEHWLTVANDEEETKEDRQEASEEHNAISEFFEEFTNCDDWECGTTLINENYWVEYVEELVKDCGYINDSLPDWIANNIDWQGVADEVEVDYIYDNGFYAR